MSRLIHAKVWQLAGPMILSNISIPLLGLVDTAVMGHLSQPYYLGAVAIGGLVFSFLYWGFGFLRMGTTGLTAQALGQDDADEMRASLGRPLLLSLFCAVLVLLLQLPINSIIVLVLEASAEVEHYAQQYFFIRIWSAPAALVNYVLIGWFIGMQNTRGPLLILLVVNGINIILDLIFVWLLHMDVAGVALASVIAEYVGIAVGLILVRQELKLHRGHWTTAQIFNLAKIRTMLSVNRNIFIRTLCLLFSFAFFTAQGAKHGDVILAANAILMNFQSFMAYALDGFANAAEALVGKAIGRRDKQVFKSAINTAVFWSAGFALLFMLIYGLFGQAIIALLTDIESVREMTLVYLPWLIVAPILSVWSYLFDGIFIGATRSAEMRNTMLISTLIFLVAWWLLQPWGNHGLWAALMVFMVARGLSMLFGFLSIARKDGFVAIK